MIPTRSARARGKHICEKHLNSKISCQTPFMKLRYTKIYIHLGLSDLDGIEVTAVESHEVSAQEGQRYRVQAALQRAGQDGTASAPRPARLRPAQHQPRLV
jgi:hypothetical protein